MELQDCVSDIVDINERIIVLNQNQISIDRRLICVADDKFSGIQLLTPFQSCLLSSQLS